MSIKMLIMEASDRVQAVEKEIGAFVRKCRTGAGLSQEVLAERCGIVRRTLFSLETGEGGNVTTLLSVLEELGVMEEATSGLRISAAERSASRKQGPMHKKPTEDRSPRVPAGENPWVLSDHAVL